MSSQLVLCSVHRRLRPERYLQRREIYNADGEVVRTAYQCYPEDSCDKRAGGRDQYNASASRTPTATDAVPEAVRMYGGREARGRYFDLGNHDGGIDNTTKKVCFVCGLADHERDKCPNMLCRACHGPFTPNGMHQCQPLSQISDFIDVRAPTDDELAGVRCPVCNCEGHLDCVPIASSSVVHRVCCASCGSEGHHAFQCSKAPIDRWIMAQQRLLEEVLARRSRVAPSAILPTTVAAEKSPTRNNALHKRTRSVTDEGPSQAKKRPRETKQKGLPPKPGSSSSKTIVSKSTTESSDEAPPESPPIFTF